MAELARLDGQQRAGTGDARKLAARRHELLGQLERVYGELDDHAAPVDA
jgi:hypothetical protein